MTDTARNTAASSTVNLLTHYSFEQGEFTTQQLVDQWIEVYPWQWMHLAVVEALYQGRYKAISVEQILAFWHRRGRPIYRFNGEFERLVCSRFPQKLSAAKDEHSAAVPRVEAESSPTRLPQARTSPPVAPINRPDPQKSSGSGGGGSLLSRIGSANTQNSSRVALQETRPQASVPDLPTSATVEDKPVPSSARQAAVASSPRGMEVEEIPPPTEAGVSRVKSRTGNIHQADEPGLRQFPIHQFVPRSEPSDFYTKLTAIAVGASRSKY